MKITVVVLNYNGLKNTLDCLASVESADKRGLDTEILVVDNCSSDGSTDALSKLKNIRLIRNKENLGYSGGNNVGIKASLETNMNAVLILNNDTVIDKNLLINFCEASKFADIISPKIYFERGFEFHKGRYLKKDVGRIIWYAGGKIDWENVLGKHIGVDEVDVGQFEESKEIDFATGACMFVKKEVFKKIGLFDERYFLYLEDMDFCIRAKKAGFKIVYEPKAIVWHKNAQSSQGSGSTLQDYFITRNRLLLGFKFARLKTKLALLKQTFGQLKNPVRRRATLDFVTGRFGKGTYL